MAQDDIKLLMTALIFKLALISMTILSQLVSLHLIGAHPWEMGCHP